MKQLIKNFIFFILSPFVIKKLNTNAVYITFDDGPHPENTFKVIDILKEYDVHASFFVSGKEVDKYPEVLKALYEAGHSICYHAYEHNHASEKSFGTFIVELDKVSEFEEQYGVKFKRLYRPPYGELTIMTLYQLIVKGWKVVLWSVDSRDSFDGSEQVFENVSSKNIVTGDILLFHDDYDLTIELLPKILAQYKEVGVPCEKL